MAKIWKYFRITGSVLCGVACVLLIVLWVRSYSALESWLCGSLHIQSAHGKLIIFEVSNIQILKALIQKTNPEFNGYSKVPFGRFTPSIELSNGIAGSPKFSVRFVGKRVWIIPFWVAIAITAILPVPAWIKWNLRFSLRTLLIATTLVAVVLGLAVYAARSGQ
jgi:hypothetical protein